MTTEQKARAYDEALERARSLQHDNGWVTTIFPELKESENEKIRKKIISIIEQYGRICEKEGDPCLELNDCLAYLKKHTESTWTEEDESFVKCTLPRILEPDNWTLEQNEGDKERLKEFISRQKNKYLERQKKPENVSATTMIPSCWTEKQKKRNGENEEDNDFTIYHPLKNGKGKYECIPYSFYGSLTSFSKDKDLIDFLRTCFYTEEACKEWIAQQKEQNSSVLQDAFERSVKDYSLEEKSKAADYADSILPTSVAYGESEDEYKLHKVIEAAYIAGQKEQKPIECIEFDNEFDNQVSHLLASVLNKEHDYTEDFVKYAAQSLLGYAKNELKPAEWSDDSVHTRFAFYTYKDEPEVLYLSNVFVEESSRNNGLGTLILKAAEKVAETIGATSIRLKVKKDSPVKAWYHKHGYDYMTFEGDYDWLEKTLEYLKLSEQEWSEEDESFYDSIMCEVVKEGMSFTPAQVNWFKCLPERFNLQSKQEWGEKDKAFLMVAIAICNKYSHKDIADWLKSLHPQPRWKPSGEQMKALEDVIKCELSAGMYARAGILQTLQNDLKKL